MSTKQTRKSVSISGELYAALKEHCERESLSMSGYFETLGRADLGMPQRTIKRALEGVKITAKPEAIAARIAAGKIPPPRKLPRPVTKLKEQTAPQPEAVEVIRTKASVSATARAQPKRTPEQQLRADRAAKFKEWDEKEQARKAEVAKREAGNIFTF